MTLPAFEIVTTSAGAVSIRDNAFNEIMHNPVGPWAEANALYIEQSKLKTKLNETNSNDEIVLFDVGLGAATNAVAAIHCLRQNFSTSKKLKIISFEKNLELLKFVLDHLHRFDYFSGFESALRSILQDGEWRENKIQWELRHGEFLDSIEKENERPHLIFFDPYSPKVNREMWTTLCFQKLFSKCRKNEEEGTLLYTYSQATPIRTALLAAGFFVGDGNSTGLKQYTTEAATRLKDLNSPLNARWLKRWRTSHTPYPYDCTLENQTQLRNTILRHPQFIAFA